MKIKIKRFPFREMLRYTPLSLCYPTQATKDSRFLLFYLLKKKTKKEDVNHESNENSLSCLLAENALSLSLSLSLVYLTGPCSSGWTRRKTYISTMNAFIWNHSFLTPKEVVVYYHFLGLSSLESWIEIFDIHMIVYQYTYIH